MSVYVVVFYRDMPLPVQVSAPKLVKLVRGCRSSGQLASLLRVMPSGELAN